MSGRVSLPFLVESPEKLRGFVTVAPVDSEKYVEKYDVIQVRFSHTHFCGSFLPSLSLSPGADTDSVWGAGQKVGGVVFQTPGAPPPPLHSGLTCCRACSLHDQPQTLAQHPVQLFELLVKFVCEVVITLQNGV